MATRSLELTDHEPVAVLALDLQPAHLDRTFDYAVPAEAAETARPGVRVRVRFHGRLVDGFVLERRATSAHGPLDSLQPLVRVSSPEVVLTPEIARLARAVADRWAGTMSDVLRLAVPPRHASVDKSRAAARATAPATSAVSSPAAAGEVPPTDLDSWHDVANGASFLAALRAGRAPRAVWTAPPGLDPFVALVAACAQTFESGAGVLVVVPDIRDVNRLEPLLAARLGADAVGVLVGDLPPATRYRRFLQIVAGERRVVVGTRAAMFAPVVDPRLLVVWDDIDDSHNERRAPYPNTRDVLVTRASETGAAFLVASTSRSVESQRLVESGWARSLTSSRTTLRALAPRVVVAGESDEEVEADAAARSARLPTVAWRAAHDGLRTGPVLVQVPRRGYVPSLACQQCRRPARCQHCGGPVVLRSAHAIASCGWCARPLAAWTCPSCGSHKWRATAVGARRTAEELGRAFPGFPVRLSGRDSGPEGVLDQVDDEPALVISTPGAEPRAVGGYATALLLDASLPLWVPDLRAAEWALHRWITAASLVRSTSAGGQVVLVGGIEHPSIAALVRWDPIGFATREWDERAHLRLPPSVRMAALVGPASSVSGFVKELDVPIGDVMGPLPVDEGRVRTFVRSDDATALARSLSLVLRARSARGERDVNVRLDPVRIG